jgi:hypothetical protein
MSDVHVAARLVYCQSDIPRVIMVTSTRTEPTQRNQIRRPARALGICWQDNRARLRQQLCQAIGNFADVRQTSAIRRQSSDQRPKRTSRRFLGQKATSETTACMSHDACPADVQWRSRALAAANRRLKSDRRRRTDRRDKIIMVCETVLGTVGMRDGNIYFSRDVKRRATPIYATCAQRQCCHADADDTCRALARQAAALHATEGWRLARRQCLRDPQDKTYRPTCEIGRPVGILGWL